MCHPEFTSEAVGIIPHGENGSTTPLISLKFFAKSPFRYPSVMKIAMGIVLGQKGNMNYVTDIVFHFQHPVSN